MQEVFQLPSYHFIMLFTKTFCVSLFFVVFFLPSIISTYKSSRKQLKQTEIERTFKRSLPHESHRFKKKAQTTDLTFVLPTQIKPNSYLFTITEKIDNEINFTIKNNSITAMNLFEEKNIPGQKHFLLDPMTGVVSLQGTSLPASFNSFLLPIQTLRKNTGEFKFNQLI